MSGRQPANIEELRAEAERIRRESLRLDAERARSEQYKAQLEAEGRDDLVDID